MARVANYAIFLFHDMIYLSRNDHTLIVVTKMCFLKHDFFLSIVESATADLNVMKWPCPAHYVGDIA